MTALDNSFGGGAFGQPAFAAAPDGGAARERVSLALIWLIGALSGIVMWEPSPYEFLIAFGIIWFAASGMRILPTHVPLVILLLLYNIGYAFGVVPVIGLDDTLKWTVVSCFMSVTTLFFAVILAQNTERRLKIYLDAYIIASLIVSVVAILAYFRLLPSSESFLFAQRAKSTFKDPNVFGPFLILPMLIIIQRMMFGTLRDLVSGGARLLVIAAALFLSFSRGAWGHFAASAIMMVALLFITTRSPRRRTRIIIFTVLGVVALAMFVVALLSLDQVQSLFKERASLNQTYDQGRFGRFGRHILGALLALDSPNGIGPLQFTRYFPEDPHNSFLDSFMAGGWLSGITYLVLVIVTVVMGLRYVFLATPWQPYYIAIYTTFLAQTGESYIIDVQHWRSYFLLMGLVWGLMALAPQWRQTAERDRSLRVDALPRPT